MEILDFFLEPFGLDGLSGVDVLFAACAIIGTALFLIYFILVVITGAADGVIEGFGVDLELDATGFFHMLTLQGLLSFVMMFGIFGLAVSTEGQSDNAVLAIVVGTIAGLTSMYIIGKVFDILRGLESDGNVVHSDAIGSKGRVYLKIPRGKDGQVQVEFQGALRTMTARASDSEIEIPTGTLIQVVDTIGDLLVVQPINGKKNEIEESE